MPTDDSLAVCFRFYAIADDTLKFCCTDCAVVLVLITQNMAWMSLVQMVKVLIGPDAVLLLAVAFFSLAFLHSTGL